MNTSLGLSETRTKSKARAVLSPDISAQDRELLRAAMRMWPLPLLGAMVTLLAVSFAVTNDGAHYLALADVMRSGFRTEDWNFVREPGLPFLLNITVLSPVGIPGYLAVSGLMAGTATATMGGVFFDLGKDWQRLLAGTIALSASTFISYAGYPLQQIGLAFLLALTGLNIRFIQTADGIRPLRLISLGVIGAVGLYYSFVFAGTVLLSVVIVSVIVAKRIRGTGTRFTIVAIASVALVLVIPAVAYAPWHALKPNTYSGFTSGGDLPAAVGAGVQKQVSELGPVAYVRDKAGIALMQLHLPALTEATRGVPFPFTLQSEDVIWASTRSTSENPQCRVRALMSPESEAKVDRVLDGKAYCQPVDGSGWLAATATPSFYLGAVSSIAMIAGTVWAGFRRRELLAVLTLPWGWIAMYSLSIPVDRYSIPIWPYKVVFGTLVILLFGGWLLDRIRSSSGLGTSSGDRDVRSENSAL